MQISKLNILFVTFMFILCLYGTCIAEQQSKVIVFHAGSLSVPFEKIEHMFEEIHPNIDIQRESGGSTKMARMISELNKPADIMVSADYKVIDNLLIPHYANWNIRFATNQMVLAYTNSSRYANEINNNNWFDILSRKDVVWGHADPNLDPCGYRSLMTIQLAEIYYKKEGIYNKLLANRPLKNIRPKSVELISLLETGNMDYAWEYLSVAIQHNLKFIKLSDYINLRDYKKNDFYKHAKVEVSGKTPRQKRILTGKSCTYGMTILNNAPNKKSALMFTSFLLNPEYGLRVLKNLGQPPLIPCIVPNKEMYKNIDNVLLKYVNVK